MCRCINLESVSRYVATLVGRNVPAKLGSMRPQSHDIFFLTFELWEFFSMFFPISLLSSIICILFPLYDIYHLKLSDGNILLLSGYKDSTSLIMEASKGGKNISSLGEGKNSTSLIIKASKTIYEQPTRLNYGTYIYSIIWLLTRIWFGKVYYCKLKCFAIVSFLIWYKIGSITNYIIEHTDESVEGDKQEVRECEIDTIKSTIDLFYCMLKPSKQIHIYYTKY